MAAYGYHKEWLVYVPGHTERVYTFERKVGHGTARRAAIHDFGVPSKRARIGWGLPRGSVVRPVMCR